MGHLVWMEAAILFELDIWISDGIGWMTCAWRGILYILDLWHSIAVVHI